MPERKLPYDIFINHRGPDTKRTLATDLYNTLNDMGLRVFLDAQELEFGDFLPKEIEEVMRRASLHIAILSARYAQSPWCLAELSFMLKTGAPIVPIFYNVQPDEVRYTKGVYGHSFLEHEKKGRYTSEKLQEWKKALNNVSYNHGGIIRNEDDEGSLLKSIIDHVLRMIKKVPFVAANHPIGLDEAVIDFERTTFQFGESSVQIVGIWGMGGSGKTTLAKQIYNNKYTTMDKSSFLLDVRDAASRSRLHKKQKKLLQDLGLQGLSVDNIEEGKGILANRLRSVRVLIVLDDVDNEDQLDALVPNKDSLGWGSLIVVTTREREVLQCWGISSIYKMKLLDRPHAKQLFCWHAFLKPTPLPEFEDLIESFLNVCKGLPLSLKIFGAQLYDKSSKDYWKTQLHKISRILNDDVKDRLKISYDALDDEEKQIFLDAACFFIGEKKTLAIAAWDGLGWSGLHSCERLLNKCFIDLDDGNCIRMHDHLRDLGREIANHQSPYRLWSTQQIISVDNEAQRICIRGIMATTFGCTSKFEEFSLFSQGREIIVNTNRGCRSLTPSFLGLKYFHVRGNYFNQIIADISKDLVWLRWFDIGHKNLGSLGSLEKLKVLEIYEESDSKHFLEELWEPDSNAPVQLSELVISECYNFQRFPKSIGFLKDLKKLVLSNSFRNNMIRSLPKEFCSLQLLEHLELSGCHELSSLPSSFGHLRNLRHLDLSSCEELKRLPVSFKELTLLQYLNLGGCSKLTLESNVLENMMKLEHLDLSKCERLEEWPRHITNQGSLRELNLGGISRVREIPMNISQLSKLQVMTIGSELLTCLPTSLGDLSSLTTLVIDKCPKLQHIPESLGHLNLLKYLEISDSGLQSLPKSVRQLNNLQTLSILGCPISQLDLQAWSCASSLCSLEQINLLWTEVSKISIPQDCCPGLETLYLDFNKRLMEIEILPSTVRDIRVTCCKMVRSLWGIDGLVNIQSLQIRACPKLDALPSFAQFSSLRIFELQGCYRVRKIHGLEHCTALEELTVETRWTEVGIQRLERMERLKILKLTAISRSAIEGCIESMKKWPDEILICTQAVLDAASFANFVFRYLSVINSTDNQNMSSNTQGTLLCFVVECQSPKAKLALFGDNVQISSMELEEGKCAWIGLFSQGSHGHQIKKYRVDASPLAFFEGVSPIHIRSKCTIIPLDSIISESSMISESPRSMMPTIPSYEVEIAFVVRGEMGILEEAFKFLWQTVPH